MSASGYDHTPNTVYTGFSKAPYTLSLSVVYIGILGQILHCLPAHCLHWLPGTTSAHAPSLSIPASRGSHLAATINGKSERVCKGRYYTFLPDCTSSEVLPVASISRVEYLHQGNWQTPQIRAILFFFLSLFREPVYQHTTAPSNLLALVDPS